MPDQYISALVVALLDDPEKAIGLNWRHYTGTHFRVELGDYILDLAEQQNEPEDENPPDYVLTLYNRTGVEIDSVADPDLISIRRRSFRDMQKLYGKVRAKAMGVDRAVKSIFNELNLDLDATLRKITPLPEAPASE